VALLLLPSNNFREGVGANLDVPADAEAQSHGGAPSAVRGLRLLCCAAETSEAGACQDLYPERRRGGPHPTRHGTGEIV
jgi:hypothetical protein